MIRLNIKVGPQVIDLGHGVVVTALPITTMVIEAVQRRLSTERVVEPFHVAREAGVLTIVGWEGVADPDGAPAEVTPDNIRALLDLYPVGEAWQRLHVGPALVLAAEKNASAPSPTGTSAGAKGTATPAASGAPRARTKSTRPIQ